MRKAEAVVITDSILKVSSLPRAAFIVIPETFAIK